MLKLCHLAQLVTLLLNAKFLALSTPNATTPLHQMCRMPKKFYICDRSINLTVINAKTKYYFLFNFLSPLSSLFRKLSSLSLFFVSQYLSPLSSLSKSSLSLFLSFLSFLFTSLLVEIDMGLLVEIGIASSGGDRCWFASGDHGFGCGMDCGSSNLFSFGMGFESCDYEQGQSYVSDWPPQKLKKKKKNRVGKIAYLNG